MVEHQPSGVEERALESLHRADVARHAAMDSAIHRIADNRVTDRAQVHADLMRAGPYG
jgi:hypothetical protein